jgi:hypothetical protein
MKYVFLSFLLFFFKLNFQIQQSNAQATLAQNKVQHYSEGQLNYYFDIKDNQHLRFSWDSLKQSALLDKLYFHLINKSSDSISITKLLNSSSSGPVFFALESSTTVPPGGEFIIKPRFSDKNGKFMNAFSLTYMQRGVKQKVIMHTFGYSLLGETKQEAKFLHPDELAKGEYHRFQNRESPLPEIRISPISDSAAKIEEDLGDKFVCWFRYPTSRRKDAYRLLYWNERDTIEFKAVELDSSTSYFVSDESIYFGRGRVHVLSGGRVLAKYESRQIERGKTLYLHEEIRGAYYYDRSYKRSFPREGYYVVRYDPVAYYEGINDSILNYIESLDVSIFSRESLIIEETTIEKAERLNARLAAFQPKLQLEPLIWMKYDSYHGYWGGYKALNNAFTIHFDQNLSVPEVRSLLREIGMDKDSYRLQVYENTIVCHFKAEHSLRLGNPYQLDKLWQKMEVLQIEQRKSSQAIMN